MMHEFIETILKYNLQKMEEWKKQYMIRQNLSQEFNPQQWKIIRSYGRQEFIKGQQQILSKLMKDQKAYDKYFKIFYQNHVKLVHWFMLATRNKNEMKEYVFKPLINHRITFYNEKIKEAFLGRQKKLNEKQGPKMGEVKEFQQQLMKDFFQDILIQNQKYHTNKPQNLKLYGKNNLKHATNQRLDGHEFYIRTFNACNGRKYIYYDFQKHMKGMSQRYKYNAFLRTNQENKLFNYKEEMNDLSKFQQFQQQRKSIQKCAFMPFNEVLKNTKINSQKGFRSVLRNTKSDKLVFVNHQGKPITYKLSASIK